MDTLKPLFTSQTRIKILSLLLFTDKTYYLRELSKKINTTPIHVSKELKNLEKINLVTKTRLANLTLYKINKNCKILKELKEIFQKCKK
tara:strand:- start:44 stop:310 length:267 start_codon:yes stop_codon:yes gene_type:complete